METQKEIKSAEVTQEVIDAWIAKYGKGKIKQIDFPVSALDETVRLSVYARVPDRRILNEWEKFSDKNPDKAKEILVKNCLLTDVTQVCADEDLFFAAYQAITELKVIAKATIKNL